MFVISKFLQKLSVNMYFLSPSRHNYPYDSKVLKSIIFTLRRHVSANTGPSSGQQRTYKKHKMSTQWDPTSFNNGCYKIYCAGSVKNTVKNMIKYARRILKLHMCWGILYRLPSNAVFRDSGLMDKTDCGLLLIGVSVKLSPFIFLVGMSWKRVQQVPPKSWEMLTSRQVIA
jgi:hypothetical protein